jgi:predicted nucleic acid-binding protein
MILIDTSVAVAAFASWHEFHGRALAALDRRPELPAHAALETYSVLTRLPAPHRASPTVVRDFLLGNFPGPLVTLRPAQVSDLISELADVGIVGGATYDALIGAAARASDATLVTCDLRATRTYDLLGVAVEYLGREG